MSGKGGGEMEEIVKQCRGQWQWIKATVLYGEGGGSRELGRVMGTQWKWCLFSIPRRIKSPESEFSSMSYKVQTLK